MLDSLNHCDKCRTFVKVFELDGRLLGKACGCYFEEIDKASPQIEVDRQRIEEVRKLAEASQTHIIDTL